MNCLLTIVGITIVSFLLTSPFFLQPQNTFEKNAYGQGYGSTVFFTVIEEEAKQYKRD